MAFLDRDDAKLLERIGGVLVSLLSAAYSRIGANVPLLDGGGLLHNRLTRSGSPGSGQQSIRGNSIFNLLLFECYLRFQRSGQAYIKICLTADLYCRRLSL